MKFFNIFLIIVGMFCSFTEGEIHHYNLEIIEKGTTFTEGIEIDEEQKVEIFRVPAHNNVSAADFYHDFEMGVTVIKMLSEKVCYITSMDPSLPSPRKLKEDIQRALWKSLPILCIMYLLTTDDAFPSRSSYESERKTLGCSGREYCSHSNCWQ
ncbi:uncharacterized protein [Montipora capricornis]|uniref:uncharacterized protein isoform X1 n=1 Tax=Montipora capricornis TaxID=246305 RepID=UPI0035F167ED